MTCVGTHDLPSQRRTQRHDTCWTEGARCASEASDYPSDCRPGRTSKQMPFLVWTWWRNERCESWCIIGSSKIVLIIHHHCDCHWHHHCQYQHQLRGKVKICIIWYVNYLRLKQRTTLCDFPTASDLSALRQTASWEGAALMFVSSMKPRKMMTTESKWTIYLVLDHVQ